MQDPRVRPLSCNREHVQSCLKKTLALCTGTPGWLLLVGRRRTASWLEQPSDCPVLMPPAPPYLEPTALALHTPKMILGGRGTWTFPYPDATAPGHWDGKRAARSMPTTCSSQTSPLWACIKKDALVQPARKDF